MNDQLENNSRFVSYEPVIVRSRSPRTRPHKFSIRLVSDKCGCHPDWFAWPDPGKVHRFIRRCRHCRRRLFLHRSGDCSAVRSVRGSGKDQPSKAEGQEMASKRHNVRILLFYFLILCLPSALFGQMNTGEITGSITDPSGAFVPQATIAALEVATQQKHTATSNSAGQYLLPQLPLGEYELTVEAQGFKQTFENGVVLHV